MKVISTNIGKPFSFMWNGKEEKTGIFKYPTHQPITLGFTDVKDDTVVDRKHHAGEHKACFLFSADQYPYWKKLYPNLAWNWGMFGENLTINGLNESLLRIGDIYKIGTAVVQVSQPREPCYKLGVRFEDQGIIKKYIDHQYPGTYVRILEQGKVHLNDPLILVEQSTNTLTINQFYELLFAKHKDPTIMKLAINNKALPLYKRKKLQNIKTSF